MNKLALLLAAASLIWLFRSFRRKKQDKVVLPQVKYVPKIEYVTRTVQVPPQDYVEVLFFPDSRMPCDSFNERLKGYNSWCKLGDKCTAIHYGQMYSAKSSLVKILLALSRANFSIDLCMFSFTYQPLADFLIYLHNERDVEVRVILDKKNPKYNQADLLESAGIPIKTNGASAESCVHNKFVIIDKRLVIHGSLNWTLSAISRNQEACVIDSSPSSAEAFVEEFEKLWANFEFRYKNSARIWVSKRGVTHYTYTRPRGVTEDYVVGDNNCLRLVGK